MSSGIGDCHGLDSGLEEVSQQIVEQLLNKLKNEEHNQYAENCEKKVIDSTLKTDLQY